MKKHELRTGMYLILRNGQERIVMLGTKQGDTTASKKIETDNTGNFYKRLTDYFELEHWNDGLTSNYDNSHDVMIIRNMYGGVIYERKERIIKLDGIEYSESTLRSLIKKATK